MSYELHEQIAGFWARFLPEENRELFYVALMDRLRSSVGDAILYNDYDPSGELLKALHDAGIMCRGYMFSGRDVGFPNKTGTQIMDGVAMVKQGYGMPWEPLGEQ